VGVFNGKVEYKEFWWEGCDFHCISMDDRHVILRNCTIYSTTYKITDSKGVQYEETIQEFRATGRLELAKSN